MDVQNEEHQSVRARREEREAEEEEGRAYLSELKKLPPQESA